MGFKDLLLNNKQQRQQNKINQLNKKGMELMQSLLYKEALDFFLKAEKIDSTNEEIQENIKECQNALNNIKTRHIDKNGFSFDCPNYYALGDYLDDDGIHESMIALSNKGICEIYIMEYKDYAFDFKARRNTPLLKAYLKREGYKDVNENEFLPYCFDAKMNSEFGVIKTTILFNFKYEHVIMIVGNMLFNSKYDCSEDIKIINKSLSYTQLSKSFYIDNIYGVDFKIPEEYKLWHENSDETEIGIFKYKYYKNSNDLSLDIMVSTNKDPDYSLDKALGFEKIINGHNGKYHEGKLYDVIDDSPTFMYYAGDDKYVSVSVDDKKLFELIIIPSDKNSVDH